MERAELAALIDQGYSTHAIARLKQTSQTNVRYWLQKYGLRTNGRHKRHHICADCGETDPTKFYGKMKLVCSRCFNVRTLERSRDTIARIREQMGNRCTSCGFDKYSVSLDMHHLDTNTKDPDFSHMRFWSWKRVQREADKCVLLCKNCHAAVHAGLLSVAVPGQITRTAAGTGTLDEYQSAVLQ